MYILNVNQIDCLLITAVLVRGQRISMNFHPPVMVSKEHLFYINVGAVSREFIAHL